jgi:hypothetical protein
VEVLGGSARFLGQLDETVLDHRGLGMQALGEAIPGLRE